MATNKTIYKEPKGYFNASMKKAAKEWESAQKTKGSKPASVNKKGK